MDFDLIGRRPFSTRRVSRTVIQTGLALLWLGARAASACPTLTTSNLEEYLAQGQIAFALDAEGKAPSPWYFDLTQVSSAGAITATMSHAASTPSDAAPFYTATGTVSGSGALSATFTFWTGIPGVAFSGTSYSYSGAIMFADTQCDLLIAGTYTSTYYTFEETRLGSMPVAHTAPPSPFSGKLVGYVFE